MLYQNSQKKQHPEQIFLSSRSMTVEEERSVIWTNYHLFINCQQGVHALTDAGSDKEEPYH